MSVVGLAPVVVFLIFVLVAAAIPGCTRAVVARMSGIRVPGLVIGVGPRLLTLRWSHTRVQIRAVPIGAFSQVAGLSAVDEPVARDAPDAFANRPLVMRALVLFAGAIGYFACALVLSIVTHAIGGVPTSAGAVVDGVVEGKPAARAGLATGDEILTIDGAPIADVTDVAPAIAHSHGAIDVRVRRDDRELDVSVVPVEEAGARRIGIQLTSSERMEQLPLGRAIVVGATYPFRYARFLLQGLVATSSGPTTISGPIGIVRVAKRTMPARQPFLWIALLVNLALFMLVPVAPYDGGRALARLWKRQRRDLPAARYLGRLAFAAAPFTAGDVAMLALFAVAALPFVIYIAPAWAFAGLLRQRPLAWSFAAVTTPAMALAGLVEALVHDGWLRLAGVALALLWLAVALWLRSAGVRRRFGLACAACDELETRAVIGGDALSCLACGSSWRRQA